MPKIQVAQPKYKCECCGREVRRVNVVNNKNLCHECTILALRVLDSQAPFRGSLVSDAKLIASQREVFDNLPE